MDDVDGRLKDDGREGLWVDEGNAFNSDRRRRVLKGGGVGGRWGRWHWRGTRGLVAHGLVGGEMGGDDQRELGGSDTSDVDKGGG